MPSKIINKLSDIIADRFGAIIAITIILTLLFLYAWQTIEPNTSAESMESQSEIHDAYQRYEDNFRPSIHGIPVVCKAKDGNVLNMEEMRDIIQALEIVKNDKIVNPMLIEYFDDTLLMNVTSIQSLPTSIGFIMDGDSPYGYQFDYHSTSSLGADVNNATDEDLNRILDELFEIEDDSGAFIFKEVTSVELKQEGGRWNAPVLMLFIGVDNSLLEINYTYDEGEKDKKYFEDFDLHVIDILQDNIDTCEVYGVGTGINTEINEEINQSIPFIMFTFIVISIILALTFKNNPKSFIAGAIGLPIIVVWMKGTERLLDIAFTNFNAFLPILIMALGVDYAIHSMKRFDEELIAGKSPREAVRGSVSKLTGTLALAMLTTFVAFFSNALSTIPALRDWGIEAALAIVWTLIIMGIFVPALRLAFERSGNRDVPYFSHLKSKNEKTKNEKQNRSEKLKSRHEKLAKNKVGSGLSKMTISSMAHPGVIVGVLILLAIPMGYGTLNLGTDFEVEEFFNPRSDFVVGLNLYTEHFPTGGEPQILLIEGDIAEPSVLEAIDTTRERLRNRGYATWYGWDITQIIQNFTENLNINNMIRSSFGLSDIVIDDTNSDLIPDSRDQIHSILAQISAAGTYSILEGQVYMVLRPDEFKEIIHYNSKKDVFDKTYMVIGVSGSGSLEAVKVGMDNILKDAEIIEDTGEVEIIVTGTGPLRYEQLTAISNSMQYSIIITIIICFIILLVVFRQLAFSFIAIIPVILIAVWLYGIMFYTGYNLNIVTATIGAMSIGVGVDYSIHICDRFRKEKAEGKNFNKAMHNTVSNTGAALLFSSLTTAFGFFVMLFAPMPMFFSFGLFSGLMVLFAFVASVIIVPPLIRLTKRNSKK